MASKTMSQLVLGKAAALKPRHIDLINRRAVLMSLMNRADDLVKTINKELNPVIDLELAAAGALKTVVVVKAQAVEVSKFDVARAKYKEVCEEALGADLLEKMLAEKDKNGDLVYKTTSTTYKSKVVGPASI